MAVLRIVPNIAMDAPGDDDRARHFYGDLLGLTIVMDHGWIVTFAAEGRQAAPQLSLASEGGSGAPVPDLSIEVDDLDTVHAAMVRAGVAIAYPPSVEPWGVRRFFVRDTFGRLLNILAHA